MKGTKMGLLDKIKQESKKAGQSKGKFIYFREGEKKRIRFLTDFEDGMEIIFHDSFEKGINVPCQEMYHKDCEYCEMEGLRTRSLFAWSVYDYDAKEVKILMQAVNNCTAIPAIMALYENYGTLLDRDLVITRSGKQQSTTYAVVPMDKNTFRNSKARPLSEKAVLKYLAQAYPDENAEDTDIDEDDYEDDEPKTKKKSPAKKKPIEEEEEDDWDDEGDEEEVDYSSMSAKELYRLCKERKLDVLPKKTEKYYIKQLQEYDQAHSDWEDDEDDEEDWEE
jgi:hypothetical protein